MATLFYDGMFYVKIEGRKEPNYHMFYSHLFCNGIYGLPIVKHYDYRDRRIGAFLYELKGYYK